MGQDWLAKQLGMGNRANVSRAVRIEATDDESGATSVASCRCLTNIGTIMKLNME